MTALPNNGDLTPFVEYYRLVAGKDGAAEAGRARSFSRPQTRSDNEVLAASRAASNGANFIELEAGRHRGLSIGAAGFDHSTADQAFCNFVYFHSRNADQVVRIWQASVLGQRDKARRPDYIERTLDKAADQEFEILAHSISLPKPPATGTLTLNDLLQIVAKTPPRLFTTTFLTPVGEVTLLSANGGVGKTMFALMWAICIAFGIGGLPLQIPRPAPVLFVTAEDAAVECGRRIAAILTSLHLNMAGNFAHDGANRLHVWDIEGTALWTETRDSSSGVPTPALEELERRIDATGAQQVFIDNASSVFHANHHDLTAVNSFIDALRRVASRTGCNIVLLAHVSAENETKGGSKTYYGSAAWHNGVRSRMFMELIAADNGVPEHVAVVHEKSNYGPKAEPFKLKKNPETGVLSSLTNREIAEAISEDFLPFVEAVFGHIYECFRKGNPINTSIQGSATAFKCLSDEFPLVYPEADRTLKGKVKAAISALSAEGRIVRQTIPTPDRKSKQVWVPANA
jgi:hypothetical protein